MVGPKKFAKTLQRCLKLPSTYGTLERNEQKTNTFIRPTLDVTFFRCFQSSSLQVVFGVARQSNLW